MDTQDFIFSDDHIGVLGHYLELEHFITLQQVSKSLHSNSVVSQSVLKFHDAIKQVHSRQKQEISFLKKKHGHFIFPTISAITDITLNTLENLKKNHLFLNQCNSDIIHQAVLKQPGNTLKLTGITRFIIPHQDVDYFSQLEHLKFSGFNFNCLRNLTIKGLVNLRTLSCDGNKLTTLTLKELPAVTELNCSNNLLKILDLRELPTLTKLFFYENPIITLNLQGLSALIKVIFAGPSSRFLLSDTIVDLNIKDTSEIMQKKFGALEIYLLFKKLDQRQTNVEKLEIIEILGERYTEENCSEHSVLYYPALLSDPENDFIIQFQQLTLSQPQFMSAFEIVYPRLYALDKTLAPTLDSNDPKKIFKFEQAFKQIKKRQKEEIAFLKNKHPHIYFPVITINSLQALDAVEDLLNKMNISIITNAVLEQPGKKLVLRGITRFIISDHTASYFAQLESLKFKGKKCNLLRSLTVKGLPSLVELYCENNQLTDLSIGELPSSYQPLYQNQCFSRNQLSVHSQNAPTEEMAARNKPS